MGRSAGGAFALALCSSVAGISTSTEPTLYGPVCAGKDGVGLMLLSHVMFAAGKGYPFVVDRREGSVRTRDWKAREIDSVVVSVVFLYNLKN